MNESRRHGDEKQILEWVEMVEKTRIRDQIFMSMLFLTILAIGGVGNRLVSYGKNYDIEENYRQSYETMLKNSSKILDLKLKPIIDKGRSILTNSQLCEVLENGSKDGEHEFSLEDQKVLERILTSITLQEEAVSSAAVMNFTDTIFS